MLSGPPVRAGSGECAFDTFIHSPHRQSLRPAVPCCRRLWASLQQKSDALKTAAAREAKLNDMALAVASGAQRLRGQLGSKSREVDEARVQLLESEMKLVEMRSQAEARAREHEARLAEVQGQLQEKEEAKVRGGGG